MMRAAVLQGANQLVVRDVPLPEMGPYQALVRIEACGVCNSTDEKIIQRHFVSQIPTPLILGHESVGVIVELGDRVRNYRVGQRVLRPGAEYDLAHVGIASAWGGFAEYGLVTDLAAWRADHPDGRAGGMWAKQQVVPNELDAAEATGIITLKETLFSTRAAEIGPGTTTAIVGTGPVARSFTLWAHRLGAQRLVVFGRRPAWREAFLALGADDYVCTEEERRDLAGAFDRAIEAVGSTAALTDALALVKPEGWVTNYGVAGEDDAPTPALREARATRRLVDLPVREEEVHEEMLGLIARGEVVLKDWVSHRLPLEAINEGFELLRRKAAVKVVIEM